MNDPYDIVTSSRGQNIVVDCDLTIKVFYNSSNFKKC